MKVVATILTLCFVFFSSSALPKENASANPPASYEDYGVCPFECCVYREWNVKKDTVIRKDMRNNSPVAFKVLKGEMVAGVTGVVITTKPGVARLLKPVEINGRSVEKGEIVYLFTYLGEGFYKVWLKNKVIDSGISDMDMEILSPPESIWWIKIKNKQGRTGWTNEPDNFGNKDTCG